MAIIDITHIVTGAPEPYNPYSRDCGKNITALVDWLDKNVGQYYGTGDDNFTTMVEGSESVLDTGRGVIRIGSGWEISRDWRGDPNGYVEVWYKLDINDSENATLFLLKWIN